MPSDVNSRRPPSAANRALVVPFVVLAPTGIAEELGLASSLDATVQLKVRDEVGLVVKRCKVIGMKRPTMWRVGLVEQAGTLEREHVS